MREYHVLYCHAFKTSDCLNAAAEKGWVLECMHPISKATPGNHEGWDFMAVFSRMSRKTLIGEDAPKFEVVIAPDATPAKAVIAPAPGADTDAAHPMPTDPRLQEAVALVDAMMAHGAGRLSGHILNELCEPGFWYDRSIEGEPRGMKLAHFMDEEKCYEALRALNTTERRVVIRGWKGLAARRAADRAAEANEDDGA